MYTYVSAYLGKKKNSVNKNGEKEMLILNTNRHNGSNYILND